MLDNESRNYNYHHNCGCMMNNNSNMMVENNDYPNTTTASAGFGMNQENCNCCCEKGMPSRVPTYSYEFTNIGAEETCPEREATREEMLEQIRCLKFAIVELAQYLDTHVEDEKALCLHREYANKLRDLKDKYQKVYGPLTINFPCNKWRWIEEPWPSFILASFTLLM